MKSDETLPHSCGQERLTCQKYVKERVLVLFIMYISLFESLDYEATERNGSCRTAVSQVSSHVLREGEWG